ncbi:hypothetical protein ACVMLK_21245, partial [Teichococcus aerofrigidensis]
MSDTPKNGPRGDATGSRPGAGRKGGRETPSIPPQAIPPRALSASEARPAGAPADPETTIPPRPPQAEAAQPAARPGTASPDATPPAPPSASGEAPA